MPHPTRKQMEIQDEIERVVERRLLIQADRSLYRNLEMACTEKLKQLRDYLADLERAAQQLLMPTPLIAT